MPSSLVTSKFIFRVNHERDETHEKGKRAMDRIGTAAAKFLRTKKDAMLLVVAAGGIEEKCGV